MLDDNSSLRPTPLDRLHRELGGRMVGFAGYALPVQYPGGTIAEHLQCRRSAALFDVSHMGQVALRGPAAEAAAVLERFVPSDVAGIPTGRQRYTVLLNEPGGIEDDLMVARHHDAMRLVVNAGRKHHVLRYLGESLPARIRLELEERALLALQGPRAAEVLERHAPGVTALRFMSVADHTVRGVPCWISRSGYTGEDGFEISVPATEAEALAAALLAEPEVSPAGLGARDTLRLEAGLCLYGQDIDAETTPIEAGLGWLVSPRRLEAGDFAGAQTIRLQLAAGPKRLRVGLQLEGKAPARAGAPVQALDGATVGRVTSGGFAPSLNAPVAMGYVPPGLAATDTRVGLVVRGQALPARVTPLPFLPHNYPH